VEARTVSTATGIIRLPSTGAEWGRLLPVMLVLLRGLKAVRRR